VEKLTEEESVAYFHSRPRGSQVGAIVSPQSKVVKGGRAEIEDRAAELKQAHTPFNPPPPIQLSIHACLEKPEQVQHHPNSDGIPHMFIPYPYYHMPERSLLTFQHLSSYPRQMSPDSMVA
jgi:hypothetical protein